MGIKLKDLVTIAKNNCNNQTNLSLKKKKLKKLNISEEKLLDMKLSANLNKFLMEED